MECKSVAPSDSLKQVKVGKCWFFGRKSGCKRGDACQFEHVQERRVCYFFNSAKGCRRGDQCTFVHDKKLKGTCPFGKSCSRAGCRLKHFVDDDGPQLRAKVAALETMMELFKDTMLVLEQRLEDKFDECICGDQSMRSSIVSEVQALKLELGHLSEVAFGEDQEFQFDGNHSTKKSKSCAVVVPGDTDPRSFVDDGDAKQSGPAADRVDCCDFCDDNKGQKTCVLVEKSDSLWGVQQRRICSSCCADLVLDFHNHGRDISCKLIAHRKALVDKEKEMSAESDTNTE